MPLQLNWPLMKIVEIYTSLGVMSISAISASVFDKNFRDSNDGTVYYPK